MTQYEVAKVLSRSDTAMTVAEISKSVDFTKGTIRHYLDLLVKKGVVVRDGAHYQLADGIGEADLERVKGTNIKDLL